MFKLRAIAAAVMALGCALYSTTSALAQASQIPPGEQCFQATTGINGMIGSLGLITGGSGGVNGTFPGVSLFGTQGGTGATATVVVSGGAVTAVTVINPGIGYFAGDNLSVTPSAIGGVTGFSVPVNSTSINSSLAGGAVGMYIPGTLTTKQTFQNAAGTILNTNPIQLDLNGCALIYGTGTYRQILFDRLGNEVWDQPTTATPSNSVYAGLAGGTANAITVTDTSFAGLDGQAVTFLGAITNTGATTLNPSGFGAISIVKNATSGPVALTGGEIVGGTPGNIYTATYSAIFNEFFMGNPLAAATTSPIPSGMVASFALTSCPTGWVAANGTASTVNMLGTVARGFDPTATRDPNGAAQSIGSFEEAMMATHVMLAPSGTSGFVLFGGAGTGTGTGSAVNSLSGITAGVTGLPASVTLGSDERGASTVLLYCQKS
jgi:hypothetical protein